MKNLAKTTQFSAPRVTPEQKKEVFYNYFIAYYKTGNSFAKIKETSPVQWYHQYD